MKRGAIFLIVILLALLVFNFRAELKTIGRRTCDRFFSGGAEEAREMEILLYFNNDKLDPEFSCNKTFPVKRLVGATKAPGRLSLEELFRGPTDVEKNAGYFTSLTQGIKINSIRIEKGVAYVDFSEELEKGVGGSCRVAAIRNQITQTLKQFPTVKEAVISINSRTEDILQP